MIGRARRIPDWQAVFAEGKGNAQADGYGGLALGGLRQINAIALPARLFATRSAVATATTTRHRERAASARCSIFSIPLSGIRNSLLG
jgi:hypothetical protein